ncbi:MAG TPA: aspartate 1-decarboxylase [Candidatus Omnitrophota bacterium]|nr:aspartate 1-decarboxylase [Candidatus Omnitrophota bacterium]HQO37908.1 aspartate 1-decarboxylase [Candidatus Omnitrophota bacterium]HQQ06316.1 aspartate 1-decarboxylase [Candidatus Omnitrophota bacterium]
MIRTMLKSKIHRATVTECNLYYEGSITIDENLMKAADILPGEKVEVLNINNGIRLETYAIKGKKASGIICLNGAAARGAAVGDQVIILTYAGIEDGLAHTVKPSIVKVNARNRIKN